MSEPALQQERLHLLSAIEYFIEEGPTMPGDLDDDGEPTEEAVVPKPPWAVVYIGVYDVEQKYGGPEEGGWWYDDEVLEEWWPVRARLLGSGTYDLQDAEKRFAEMIEEEMLATYDFGTSHRTSCGPRRGDDYTWRLSWRLIEHLPEVRPRYC